MRLLFIGDGQSPHLQTWEAYFVDQGDEVHLLTWYQPNQPGRAELPGVRVHYLPGQRVLRRSGLGPVRGPWLGLVARFLARRHKIELLHAHQVVPHGLYAALSGLHPLVLTAWGSDLLIAPYASSVAMSYTRTALRAADLVTADSEYLRLAAEKLGYRGPSVIVPLGVDTDLFRPGRKAEARAALGIPTDVPLVLSPRSLTPLYNIEAIIDSIPTVLAAVPGTHYLFKYGFAGGREDELRRRAEQLGVGDAVSFGGSSPVGEMADYYAAADVTISVASSDSAPRSVLESLSCGTPVVLSDLPWVEELLQDGEQVLLVQPQDSTAIAAATIRLLRDQGLRERLGAAGRQVIWRHADYRRSMAYMGRLYRALIERKPLPLEGGSSS